MSDRHKRKKEKDIRKEERKEGQEEKQLTDR